MMRLLLFFLLLVSLPPVLCCQENDNIPDIEVGTVWFKPNSTRLTKKAKKALNSFLEQIRNNPKMTIRAIAYNKDFCDKCGVRSIKRATAVLTYLSRQNIATDRLSYTSRLEGELNKVDLVLIFMSPAITPHPGMLRIKSINIHKNR